MQIWTLAPQIHRRWLLVAVVTQQSVFVHDFIAPQAQLEESANDRGEAGGAL